MYTFWWGYFHVFDGGMFVSDPHGGVTRYPVQLPYCFSRSSTYSEFWITSGLTSFPRDCGLVFIIGPSKQRFRRTNIWWSFPRSCPSVLKTLSNSSSTSRSKLLNPAHMGLGDFASVNIFILCSCSSHTEVRRNCPNSFAIYWIFALFLNLIYFSLLAKSLAPPRF